jgi:hypothetical protein
MIMFTIKKNSNEKRLFNEEIWRGLKATLINQVLDIVCDLESFCVNSIFSIHKLCYRFS